MKRTALFLVGALALVAGSALAQDGKTGSDDELKTLRKEVAGERSCPLKGHAVEEDLIILDFEDGHSVTCHEGQRRPRRVAGIDRDAPIVFRLATGGESQEDRKGTVPIVNAPVHAARA